MGFVAEHIRAWREARGLPRYERPSFDWKSDARAGVDGRWEIWIAPWRYRMGNEGYPGRWTYLSGLFGIKGLAGLCAKWRSGQRPMPSDVALRIATHIEARCDAGMKIAAELRAYAAAVPERKPVGWQVVKERDGAGSEPRDGRRRR